MRRFYAWLLFTGAIVGTINLLNVQIHKPWWNIAAIFVAIAIIDLFTRQKKEDFER